MIGEEIFSSSNIFVTKHYIQRQNKLVTNNFNLKKNNRPTYVSIPNNKIYDLLSHEDCSYIQWVLHHDYIFKRFDNNWSETQTYPNPKLKKKKKKNHKCPTQQN